MAFGFHQQRAAYDSLQHLSILTDSLLTETDGLGRCADLFWQVAAHIPYFASITGFS